MYIARDIKEVVKMSKIFKISGNFMQYGKWSEPDPSFVGEIVVDDSDVFYGYCDELYNSNTPEVDRTRFIAGAFAKNGKDGKLGMAFYKLSNDHIQAPLLYTIPELGKHGEGEWAALTPWVSKFFTVGEARVEVEECTYSPEDEKRVKGKFDKLDKGIVCNDQLLKRIQYCIDIIANAE